jgi:serine/threonine protein kinase
LFSYGEEQVNGMTLIYIVMPFRPEGSFADAASQHHHDDLLSVQDVAYFISQAVDALQYAHDKQIVHQDVKPSNFLIRTNTRTPNRPDLLLSDFGIARFSGATANISHSIRGTPAYMAPEIWSGEPTPASDQYALAVMAYELFTGHSPFTGRQEQVMYQHFHVSPRPLSTFNPALSCTGYLAYLFSNKPFISDEWHGSENQRQDLQAVETGEIVGEEAICATDVPRASTGKLCRDGPRSRFLLERRREGRECPRFTSRLLHTHTTVALVWRQKGLSTWNCSGN